MIQVEIEVELLHKADVLFLKTRSDLAHLALVTIVEPAVVKYKLHVIHIFLQFTVLVLFQLGRDGAEIHRFLDDIVVIWNAEGLDIDWLGEAEDADDGSDC